MKYALIVVLSLMWGSADACRTTTVVGKDGTVTVCTICPDGAGGSTVTCI